MKSSQAWVTVLLAVSGLQALAIAGLIAAAPKSTQTAAAPPASDKGKPVKVELNKETGQKRVTLTAKAAERLGIATADVRDEAVAPKTVALGTVQSVAEAPIIVTASVPWHRRDADRRERPATRRSSLRETARPSPGYAR